MTLTMNARKSLAQFDARVKEAKPWILVDVVNSEPLVTEQTGLSFAQWIDVWHNHTERKYLEATYDAVKSRSAKTALAWRLEQPFHGPRYGTLYCSKPITSTEFWKESNNGSNGLVMLSALAAVDSIDQMILERTLENTTRGFWETWLRLEIGLRNTSWTLRAAIRDEATGLYGDQAAHAERGASIGYRMVKDIIRGGQYGGLVPPRTE